MNKKQLSERDICTKFITPSLVKSGWNINTQIREEFPFTSGQVIVSGKKQNENVQSIEMSVAKMDIGTIKKMPALLGEVDVIKSIQTLPGVSTVGEGASGFNVRGGGVDQNLVLLLHCK